MQTQRIDDIGVLPHQTVIDQLQRGKRTAYFKGLMALLGVAAVIVFLAFATAQLGSPTAFIAG